jgi:ABC-type Na+ transport system ATPase subunit NatA
MTGLTSVSRRRAGKFSLGMTHRLGMAAALVIGGVMLVKRDT